MDPKAKRLEGKVAVITGGASGIGAATARLFLRHGAKVVIADIQDELGHALCADTGCPEAITFVHCNVTNEGDVQNAVDTAVSKYGKLDIMYSNAGLLGDMDPRILSTENEGFKKVMEVNLFGGFLCAKHAARVMIPAKKGSIIFTSSAASVICGDTPYAYAASKHALVGMAKNLCVELGQYGVRVNCISPYGVATPMLTSVMGNIEKQKAEEVFSRSAVLKEAVLEPEDIAEAALYLGSDDSKYVNGLNLMVDGGYSVTNTTFPQTVRNAVLS